jgi:hypothetical protein
MKNAPLTVMFVGLLVVLGLLLVLVLVLALVGVVDDSVVLVLPDISVGWSD